MSRPSPRTTSDIDTTVSTGTTTTHVGFLPRGTVFLCPYLRATYGTRFFLSVVGMHRCELLVFLGQHAQCHVV